MIDDLFNQAKKILSVKGRSFFILCLFFPINFLCLVTDNLTYFSSYSHFVGDVNAHREIKGNNNTTDQ